ncbi:MAG TPA: peroxiredoxin [Lapillicoccus sp.]|nr:peroxiredoxin [Lapillicoccus sp.]
MTDSTSAPLAVGEPAPSFALRNQFGERVSLDDFRGRKNVVVVFFPFAFSGICTGELGEIREHLEEFEGDDIQVLAVSCDPMESLRAWADAEGYFFPLLSDFWPHGETARAFGVFWDKTGFATRGTFLLDTEGVVRWSVVNGPGEARDFGQYRAALAELRSATASV